MQVSVLLGKKLTSVVNDGDEITFTCDNGEIYKLLHHQDCCENVSVEDVSGDLSDLVGSKILMSEEYSDNDFEVNYKHEYEPESCTWTFYRFATIKGYVNIRWFGESNGYYSEGVDFTRTNPKEVY